MSASARRTSQWDLELRKGPFLRARITTAVHWGWTPSHRVRYGPRWTILPPLAVCVGLAFWFDADELWALGLLAIAVLIETWALMATVADAVRLTTAGSREQVAEETPPPRARARPPEYARERS